MYPVNYTWVSKGRKGLGKVLKERIWAEILKYIVVLSVSKAPHEHQFYMIGRKASDFQTLVQN